MEQPVNVLHVGDNIRTSNSGWKFSGLSADEFDTHAQRSIPLYLEGHELILSITDYYLPNQGKCYELGCSTGELTKKIALHNKQKNIKIIALDIEESMIDIATEKCQFLNSISFLVDDLTKMEYEEPHLVIMYYTLQFVEPKLRQSVINRIYDSFDQGGALILFEKVRAEDSRFQDIFSNIYVDFKLNNGFTCDEIIAKSKSLKGVLIPNSSQENLAMLKNAGFKDICPIMKYICFEGLLAIK